MITKRLKSFLQREAVSIAVLAIAFVGLIAFMQIAEGMHDDNSHDDVAAIAKMPNIA